MGGQRFKEKELPENLLSETGEGKGSTGLWKPRLNQDFPTDPTEL